VRLKTHFFNVYFYFLTEEFSMKRTLLKHTLLAASLASMGFAAVAQNLPVGGTVSRGAATISTAGTTMTVTQTGGNILATNWQSFNIGAGNTVNFVQPSPQAIALNRVTGTTASTINGNLNANGQVFLINQNGILFGQTAQVNVGGLVATTKNISDTMITNNGTMAFKGAGSFSNVSSNASGIVENKGIISAGSYVVLAANQVKNSGQVNGGQDVSVLAGKDVTVTVVNAQLRQSKVVLADTNASIDNAGSIYAQGTTTVSGNNIINTGTMGLDQSGNITSNFTTVMANNKLRNDGYGLITSNVATRVDAGDLINTNIISGFRLSHIVATGELTNSKNGWIMSNESTSVTASSIYNAGFIGVSPLNPTAGALTIRATRGSITNTVDGYMFGNTGAILTAVGAITNAGSIRSEGGTALAANGMLTNSGEVIGITTTIKASDLNNTQIVQGVDALNIAVAGSVVNAKQAEMTGGLVSIGAGKYLLNAGLITGSKAIAADAAVVSNMRTGSIQAKHISIGTQSAQSTSAILNDGEIGTAATTSTVFLKSKLLVNGKTGVIGSIAGKTYIDVPAYWIWNSGTINHWVR
jgi:filamentous hemagglutinin family protein